MKQIDKLRERRIFNDCELAKRGDKIFVCYARNGGRSVLPPWWAVHHTEGDFKGASWYERGAKTFVCGKKSDEEPFIKALSFASKVCGCYEWIKSPFRGYISRFTADKVGIKYKEDKVIKVGRR